MEALRKIVQLTGKQVSFQLPENFNSEYVEVIILPYDKSNLKNDVDFQEFLLSAPVMNDEDYDYFSEKKKEFNKWK